MTDDLKRQASELYRERSAGEPIPTSDALSMKKIVYIAFGLAVLFLAVVAMFGGFRPRQDAVIAANTPPPLAKETPPPELLDPKAPVTKPVEPKVSVEQPRASVEPAKPAETPRRAEARKSPDPGKPSLKRDTRPVGAKPTAPSPVPAAPPEPKLSEIEIARREMAKDIVVEKNPALAQLVATPNMKGWSAEPAGTDQYLVTFSVVDESSGAQVQYVWRVDMATRSTTALSYYARRLS